MFSNSTRTFQCSGGVYCSFQAPELEGPPPIAVNGGGKDEPRVWRVFGSLLGGFLIKRIVTLVKKIPHHCSVSDIDNNTNGS